MESRERVGSQRFQNETLLTENSLYYVTNDLACGGAGALMGLSFAVSVRAERRNLVRALALVTLIFAAFLAPAVKSETIGPPTMWDYTFSTDFATCTATLLSCISTSGSVVFTLEQVSLDGTEQNGPCVKGGWEEVVGMTGTFNGAAISFTPQGVSNCTADQLFLPSAQQGLMRPAIASTVNFTAGGVNWQIFGPDFNPYNNSVLINNSIGQVAVVNWQLTPIVTPEPGSLAMAALGLCGLLFAVRRNKSFQIHAQK